MVREPMRWVTSRSLRGVVCLVVGGVLFARPAPSWGQAPASDGKLPAFEVASVKRNTSGSIVVNHAITGGRYTGTNLSVMDLLAAVYAPMPRGRISGGPAWITTERFDIVARAEGDPSPADMLRMVHALLIDRFRLAVHTEARDGDVYDLILARDDGRPGPMLRASTYDCAAQRASRAAAAAAGSSAPGPPCPWSNYPGRFVGTSITMEQLAYTLSVFTDQRTVRDRTGLTGQYDVELTWTPDRLGPLPPNAPDEVVRNRAAIDPNGPSLFTALQEQLGLKLEARRDKIDVLVIDRVERPSEN